MKSNRRQEVMEQLEHRQLMAASSIKMSGNDLLNVADTVAGGTAKQNANDLVITFNGKISKTVDTSKIRIFAYAADNTSDTGAQIKKTIEIVDADVDSTQTKLTLRTKMLVRKGASITLNAGSVKDTSNNDITGSAESKKGVNKARFTLAGRAFKVTDKNLFDVEVLPGGRTPAGTGSSELNETTVKNALDAFLQKKVNQGTITGAQKTAALNRFSSSGAKAIASSANIRAAILSLTGTAGEAAIEYYLGTGNATGKTPIALRFDDEFDTGARIVATNFNSQGRLRVILNPIYVGESFVALSGILAKEAFQDTKDPNNTSRSLISLDELVISNFVEVAVYGQQLVADSSYAAKGTTLTLRENHRLYVAMNSGTYQFPRVGILAAPLLSGTNAAPGFDTSDDYDNFGGTTVRSFDEEIRDEYKSRDVTEKTGHKMQKTGAAILSKLTGNTIASGTEFSDNLIKQVDQNQDALGDNDVLRLAKTLKVRI